ncbi:MAG: hypothetical protein U5K69_26850 [Balneolaceae bacterium]|nr:hypothetical protein [Balneolaceae bacterium]
MHSTLKKAALTSSWASGKGSSSWKDAEDAGLTVMESAKAAKAGDIVMILIPDQYQADFYKKKLKPNLEEGNVLAFAHGFNIHFGQIEPEENVDVFMIAPKSPGHLVRRVYEKGSGVPCLVAVYQDYTGTAKDTASGLCQRLWVVREPALLKPPLRKKLKPIFSESRLCFAVALPS